MVCKSVWAPYSGVYGTCVAWICGKRAQVVAAQLPKNLSCVEMQGLCRPRTTQDKAHRAGKRGFRLILFSETQGIRRAGAVGPRPVNRLNPRRPGWQPADR